MKFIDIPNIPQGPVSLAIVDSRISNGIEEKLKSFSIDIVKTGRYPGMYEAVSHHPDIILHHLGGEIHCMCSQHMQGIAGGFACTGI